MCNLWHYKQINSSKILSAMQHLTSNHRINIMNTPDQMVTPKPVKAKKAKAPKNARILFILDRSGSMRTIADETIGGFNAFVEGQKDLPGKATVSLVQFDNEILTVYENVAIKDVPVMDRNSFVPRGY